MSRRFQIWTFQIGWPDALSVRKDLTLLLKNLEHPDHVFWSADRHAGSVTPMAPSLRGHQQVSDAYLLALAHHHDGLVATFDRGRVIDLQINAAALDVLRRLH